MLTDILQPTHLLIVLVVALLVLGPKRLPDAGRALGQGLREFKSSITADHDDGHGPARAAIAPEEKTPVS
jgi:sec-independent protein translocase protein TatA